MECILLFANMYTVKYSFTQRQSSAKDNVKRKIEDRSGTSSTILYSVARLSNL